MLLWTGLSSCQLFCSSSCCRVTSQQVLFAWAYLLDSSVVNRELYSLSTQTGWLNFPMFPGGKSSWYFSGNPQILRQLAVKARQKEYIELPIHPYLCGCIVCTCTNTCIGVYVCDQVCLLCARPASVSFSAIPWAFPCVSLFNGVGQDVFALYLRNTVKTKGS